MGRGAAHRSTLHPPLAATDPLHCALCPLRRPLTLPCRSERRIPHRAHACLPVAAHVLQRRLRHGRDAVEGQWPPASRTDGVCKEPQGRSCHGERHEHCAQKAHRLRWVREPAQPVASQECAQGLQLQRHGCWYVVIPGALPQHTNTAHRRVWPRKVYPSKHAL
jgi:hypothetical protein